jgi:hypothetical protein
MKRLLRFSLWTILIYLLLCTAVAFFLADTTVHPYRRPLVAEAEAQAKHTSATLNSQLTDVEIQAKDHTVLRAWLIQPHLANGNAVILLHGLGDNRMGTAGYAQLLLAHGYSVLMPDARAHGESGGVLATYGVTERDEVRAWFEWLQQTTHATCVYGLGESMGAAQLLQSLAVEPHFCAAVAESSFSTFREIAYDRMGQRFGTGPWLGRSVLRPLVEIALLVARIKYHVDLTQASPEDAVAHTRVPILLIHGIVDHNIPLRHSLRLAARNPQVDLWEVPDADHCGALSVAPEEIRTATVNVL